MKTIVTKRYCCDKCGKSYETEEKALMCEEIHTNAVSLVNPEEINKWLPSQFDDGKKYPYRVYVRMENNKIFEYTINREIEVPKKR